METPASMRNWCLDCWSWHMMKAKNPNKQDSALGDKTVVTPTIPTDRNAIVKSLVTGDPTSILFYLFCSRTLPLVVIIPPPVHKSIFYHILWIEMKVFLNTLRNLNKKDGCVTRNKPDSSTMLKKCFLPRLLDLEQGCALVAVLISLLARIVQQFAIRNLPV